MGHSSGFFIVSEGGMEGGMDGHCIEILLIGFLCVLLSKPLFPNFSL